MSWPKLLRLGKVEVYPTDHLLARAAERIGARLHSDRDAFDFLADMVRMGFSAYSVLHSEERERQFFVRLGRWRIACKRKGGKRYVAVTIYDREARR